MKFRTGQEYTKRGTKIKVISRTGQRLMVEQDGKPKAVRVRQYETREFIVVEAKGIAFEIQAR